MKPDRVRLLGLIAAAVISATALMLASLADPDRLPVSPFGYYRVVVMHVVMTLLLSWFLAGFLVPDERSSGWWFFWISIGVGMVLLTAALGSFVGSHLDEMRSELGMRLLIRAGWCLALQLPWCVMSRSVAEPNVEQRITPSVIGTLLLAMVLGVVVPIGYLTTLIPQQTKIASKHWAQRNLPKTRLAVSRLSALGSWGEFEHRSPRDGAIERVSPRRFLVLLDEARRDVEAEVRRLRTVELDRQMRLDLAMYLKLLGKLSEARATVEPLTSDDPRAAALMADIFKDAEQWQTSSEWYRRMLDLLRENPAEIEMSPAFIVLMRTRAYDSLAYNARELKDFDGAEQIYFDALEAMPSPSEQAHFHYHLAGHYEKSGRLALATEHLQAARRLGPDKDQYPEPGSLWYQVLSSGSPVGIFAPAAKSE